VESSFAIIAEPNRRAILSLLASSERSVGEIERRLRRPQTSVSKHLRVLREAGFVESRVEAQRRVYRIRPEPLMEVDTWLAPFRRFWTAHVDLVVASGAVIPVVRRALVEAVSRDLQVEIPPWGSPLGGLATWHRRA
jgi:DNA-binding transcriptional ArsR family regulator